MDKYAELVDDEKIVKICKKVEEELCQLITFVKFLSGFEPMTLDKKC
jgi:hypothetical protein